MLFRPDEWWDEQEIELMTRTSVMKLDAGERVAKLSTRDEVEFDKALLATGANVRRLRVDGADLEGIHYLRAFGNSDAIRADAEQAERVVLIGGSYIGTEVAASLTAATAGKCTIVMQEDVTLERQFGPEVGGFFQRRARGARRSRCTAATSSSASRAPTAASRKVVTKGGLELDCDMVVIGAGVMPDVTLARAAGLELGESGGVQVLVAAGDLGARASTPRATSASTTASVHGRALRVEHWDVAFNQGKTAALNMLGRGVDHEVDAVLLLGPRRLGLARVRRPRHGRGGHPRLAGGRRVHGVLPATRMAARGRAPLSVGRSDDLEHARRFIAERDAAGRRLPLADVGTRPGHRIVAAGSARDSCGAGTRTPISESRGRRLAIRRPRNGGSEDSHRADRAPTQATAWLAQSRYSRA